MPIGIASPKTIEAKKIVIVLGATGALLPEAESMIRALLSVIA
ncbi:unknown [Bacteroides sp. CAG:189]|nr:unknown [Bacteroides sp. CAG:189]